MRTASCATGALLVLLIGQSVWAAKGAIPSDYHGMWGAGSCASPLFYFRIEASGIQGYSPNKRIPVADWEVQETSQAASGIAFETLEANTGVGTYMEISRIRGGRLHVLVRTSKGTEQFELEECSQHTQ